MVSRFKPGATKGIFLAGLTGPHNSTIVNQPGLLTGDFFAAMPAIPCRAQQSVKNSVP
jgi:hypothetical protein